MTSKDKTSALAALRSLGLPTLRSFAVTGKNVAEILAMQDDSVNWYVRASEQDRKVLGGKFLGTLRDLRSSIERLFIERPESALTLTQFQDSVYSGALFCAGEIVFIESVAGALEGLLTRGLAPERTCFTKSGQILIAVPARKQRVKRWHDGSLVTVGSPQSFKPPEGLLPHLVSLVTKSPHGRLYEWLTNASGDTFFLDAKATPQQFMGSESEILKGITSGRIESLPSVTGQSSLGDLSSRMHEVVLLDDTTLLEREWALEHAKLILARQGGILSHLPLYAAERRVPFIVSKNFE